MRVFDREVDDSGLRRLLPEDPLPTEELGCLARGQSAVAWALLNEPDAEDLRAELAAGRYRDTCDPLLDRAVERLPPSATAARPA
jgi:hypothetical protein